MLKMEKAQFYVAVIFLMHIVVCNSASIKNTEKCLEIYKRYSDHHTACLPPNKNCSIIKSLVSEEDIRIILREHNMYRSIIATGKEKRIPLPEAKNMLQMEWDTELQVVAQSHADQCLMEHDCSSCRSVNNFAVGQNLFQIGHSKPPTIDWPMAIRAWYDEVVFFNTDYVSPFLFDLEYGHFSQMIWAETWRLGCGYSQRKEGDLYYGLYTCDYGPSGNIIDTAMYEKGSPCSNCPINSCCDETCSTKNVVADYGGLCKILDTKAPEFQSTTDYIFQCGFDEKRNTCPTKVAEGSSDWKITSSLSGSYIGITLNGGESSTLSLTTPFKAHKAICFKFSYRKGPAVMGEETNNTAVAHFYIPSVNYDAEIILSGDDPLFIDFNMNLDWNMETRFSLSFSVPSEKPPQYFEMKNIKVKEGHC